MDLKKLQVKISDRERTIFEGEAFAVSSKNMVGPFDVLGEHANFVTTIIESVEVHKSESGKVRFDMERGILRVKENLVEIFAGI
ncbi:MAG: hypothetical protein UU32_C0034G0005 [Candidatus Woesebacteria bacterium GW2011_GWB1_41_10]|uniref:ATP synthase F1 complex delta/epsilon subunit N-terminal domain-containing protein n=1 Tax=Candidatus Woesebacteria bacterium GW2011_GWB1_41_10 TaxID=1618577 RepID=A0A0G0WMY2_9BACT|nr:MAG: hypothetical protein UU32_C0034G0005 [Candidatus Woesebacteria bacterium GW2011_GWB1_41_10]